MRHTLQPAVRPLRAHRRVLTLALALALGGCATTRVSTVIAPNEGAQPNAASYSVEAGDRARGAAVFATNCATCHGAGGTTGGVGPSLRDEKIRQSAAQTFAWIEDPAPPMPKLYPSILTRDDVVNLTAFVQSL